MTYSKSLVTSAMMPIVFAALLIASIAITTIAAGAATQNTAPTVEPAQNSSPNVNTTTNSFKIASYDSCMTTVKKVTDPAKLKKAITKAVDNHTKRLDGGITERANKLSAEHKTQMLAEIAQDKEFLANLKTTAEASTVVSSLQTKYCQAKFYKITRKAQILSLIALEKVEKRDARMQTALEGKALKSAQDKSAAKADISKRITAAKSALAADSQVVESETAKVLGANKADNYSVVNTAAFVNTDKLRNNWEVAHRNYVEALAIRKAASKQKASEPLTVKSVKLFKADGSPIEAGGKASRTATIVFTYEDGSEITTKLTREDKNKPWTFVKDTGETTRENAKKTDE